jgi:hypothetical protein
MMLSELRRGAALYAVIGIVLTGIIFRVAFFALDRHLWLDEAAIALNILDKPLETLLSEPLDRNQHAPPLFLLIEKLAYLSWPNGPIERLLRLQALITSLAGLLLFSRLVHRQLAPLAALIACALFAISPPLIRYAAEVKPYAGDVLACLILITLGVDLQESDRWTTPRLGWFAATGAVLVWYSFPAVFVMVALGAYLIISKARGGNRGAALRLAGVAGVWLLSFCLYMLLLGRHSLANRELHQFWSIGFLPFPFGSMGDVSDSFRILAGLVQSPLGFGAWELPVALLAVGLVSVRERNPLILGVTVGVILILAIASAGHLYPISTRLVLFVAPLTVCAIASGAEGVFVLCRSHWLASVVVVGALVAAQLMTLSSEFIRPPQTGFPQVLRMVSERTQEGDRIYLYHRVGTTYALYQRVLRLPKRQTIRGADLSQNWTEYRSDFNNLHGRVWLLFSDVRTSPVNEREIILHQARARGRMLEELEVGGTSAALVEMREESLNHSRESGILSKKERENAE